MDIPLMYQRLNITLPIETVELLQQNVSKGERSKFINEAVRHHILATNKEKLRQKLKEGAIRHATRDMEINAEWLNLDEEAWKNNIE